MSRPERAKTLTAGAACGLLYWLAMPGRGCWPCALVAFVPLYLWEPRRLLAAAQAGFVAGFVATLGVCAWVPESMHLMLNVRLAWGGLALALICAWHGVRFAAVFMLNHLARERGIPGWLSLPASLVAAELLVPVPFPFSFAVTVHGLPILLQVADLTGRFGIVFVLGGITAAVGETLRAMISSPLSIGAWRPVCFGLAPLVAALAYGAVREPEVTREIATATQLRVGLVQVNLPPTQKRAERARSLNEHLRLTGDLLRGPLPNLVVWSETAIAAPLDERLLPGGLVRRFDQHFPVPLLVGAVLKREQGAERTLTNSALLSTGDGYVCPECRYDKQTLVPLAEGLFSRSSRFSSSGHDRVLPFGQAHRIGVLICFETIFPERVRELVRRNKPQLLVNLTNDGWFGDSEEPALHLGLASLRAVEHRLFLVRVAATGISAIVDPLGRIVLSIPQGPGRAQPIRGSAHLE